MTVGYDGTDFRGSQRQRGARTVQAELEEAVQRVAPGSGGIVFAGRTDRGVHAIGQVVSGDVTWAGSADGLRTAINAVAPMDLVVADVEFVDARFHARFDARWREYRYRVHVGPVPPVLARRYVWWRRRELHAELAGAACARFVGRWPFGTFAGLGRSQVADADSLTRTIAMCEWTHPGGGNHELRVVADGFLPRMVRNMAAAVCTVASGDRPAEWIDDLIAANDRRVLGEAAPPEGLVLWRVYYDDEIVSACADHRKSARMVE